jgi:hypothetical protein
MRKTCQGLPIAEAVRQARVDLCLENTAVPEWGCQIFSRVESGHLTLADAQDEIDELVRRRLLAP